MILLSQDLHISPSILNRHMLVAGATGTGKTVSLLRLVDELHDAEIPYIITDIKGDVSAANRKGTNVVGLPRVPLNALGADVVAKLLELNNTQAAALKVIFKMEPEIFSWSELKMILEYVYHNPASVSQVGLVSKPTVGVILRQMVNFDDDMMEDIFKEGGNFSAFELMQHRMNIINCQDIVETPSVYAALMIGLIDSFYTSLPEAGDLDKPKMVLIIDEAHMLFSDTPKVLLVRLEQRIRLIRSRGVGIVFATQSPTDIPEVINAQIATRIQHGVRVYTELENKKAIATAKGYTVKYQPLVQVLKDLGTGYVIARTLDPITGVPTEFIQTRISLPTFDLTPQPDIYREEEIVIEPIEEEPAPRSFWDILKRGRK